METKCDEIYFSKQYPNNEHQLGSRNKIKNNNCTFIELENYDEPIDLTSPSAERCNTQQQNDIKPLEQKLSDVLENPNYFTKRRKKRKFACTSDGKLYVISNEDTPLPFNKQNVESKELEVFKAAKSLFSKRTRTLYHWMYPNAPKQQIKAAVTNSWESLGPEEREFYISQVLGRFGFPQSSLMVNPQLDSIKELPQLTEVVQESLSTKACELQNAISSIMPGECSSSIKQEYKNLGGYGRCDDVNQVKRRRGRPSGSKVMKKVVQKQDVVKSTLVSEFQDDPELSTELEKFALNMFKTK